MDTDNLDPAIAQILDVPTGAESAEQIMANFTADDIAKAREQEKSKLYSQMEKLKGEVDSLKKEREEAAQRKADKTTAREQERLAKAKAKEEAEMSYKDLLKKKEQEFTSLIENERLEREKLAALLQQEQKFQTLREYRDQRLSEERENIAPQLVDLIQGNSEEEIEQSIALLREKSESLRADFQQVINASKQSQRGASITAPASGPLDNDMGQQSLTPEGIRDMDMANYAKNRAKLLGTAATNRGQGLFG